jgi:hypothetical protein
MDVENIDIGDYVNDRRLGSVEPKYASFHGEGCDDGVLVLPREGGDGFFTQRTYTDPADGEIKHTVSEPYPTAPGALEAAIGDVQWTAEATEKA